jgi:rhodanese-related sulfurtransferase
MTLAMETAPIFAEDSMSKPSSFSFILETPAAPAEVAHRHFAAKLTLETDPSDVHTDLTRHKNGFVVADARSHAAWADRRVPGAISLPARSIDEKAAHDLRGKLVVVYCWAASCNGATRAAVRLTALGIQVKEMIGGLEAWVSEGYPVEGELPAGVSFEEYQLAHLRIPREGKK